MSGFRPMYSTVNSCSLSRISHGYQYFRALRYGSRIQILQTGLFRSAARFRLIEGFPDPAEWPEAFETDDPDLFRAYP